MLVRLLALAFATFLGVLQAAGNMATYGSCVVVVAVVVVVVVGTETEIDIPYSVLKRIWNWRWHDSRDIGGVRGWWSVRSTLLFSNFNSNPNGRIFEGPKG